MVNPCLYGLTRVLLKDNSIKLMRDLKVGDKLLGIDENGAFCDSHVTNTSIGAYIGEWKAISGKMINRGRGGHSFSLKVDPKNLDTYSFSTQNKINSIQIENIAKTNEILAVHRQTTPTLVQESIIIGLLLGDGTYNDKTQLLRFTHSTKQKDYHEWLINALGPIVNSTSKGKSGYGSDLLTSVLTRMHGMDWTGWNKQKGIIPEILVQKINPISLAVWYMDDGSIHNKGKEASIHLSTYSFNSDAHKILMQSLLKFGIKSRIQGSSKGDSIVINAESADLFFVLICPYMPPSMQYKLPEYYRGNIGWIPTRSIGYRSLLGAVQVQDISVWSSQNVKKSIIRSRTYGIETSTKNFFASRLLVSHS